MKEMKMYEAPKMEIVEVEMETMLASSLKGEGAGDEGGIGTDGWD